MAASIPVSRVNGLCSVYTGSVVVSADDVLGNFTVRWVRRGPFRCARRRNEGVSQHQNGFSEKLPGSYAVYSLMDSPTSSCFGRSDVYLGGMALKHFTRLPGVRWSRTGWWRRSAPPPW